MLVEMTRLAVLVEMTLAVLVEMTRRASCAG